MRRLIVCALLLLPLNCFGWGHEGHRIVARVAARNLTPSAAGKLAAILGVNAAGLESAMASAATWPDEIDKRNTGTDTWHYIDVPITTPFSVTGLCPNHNCVIDRIQEMEDRLGMNLRGFQLIQPPIPPRPMTSQEAAFLIHFVGDIHQPLHSATDGDRGGNCVGLTKPLTHSDHTTTTELHAVWDVDEVLSVLSKRGGEDATVAALFQQFKNGATVQQLTITDWSHEANQMARQDIYQKLHLPNHTAPAGQCAVGIQKINVSQQYIDGNVPDVEQQLMRAGIRLSNVLNRLCAGNGCTANP